MTLPIEEQLRRLADTLRNEIGPAVADEYMRTQAYMSSVILQRLAKQAEHGARHAEAEQRDLAALHEQLTSSLADAPREVRAAHDVATSEGTVATLGPLIRALYAWDDLAADVALRLIRPALRADIDRRMEVAT